MAFALMGGLKDKLGVSDTVTDKQPNAMTNPTGGMDAAPGLPNSDAPPAAPPAPNKPDSTVFSNNGYIAPAQLPPNAPPPAVAGVGIGPETGNVTSDMLVEDRLTRLLKAGNPYVDQAVARAKQQANSRGMINSSLAGQAGEEAAIGAALPIAQQDANTFFTNQRDNLGFKNQFSLADKTMLGNADLQGRDLTSREKISADGNATQLAAANISASAHLGAAAMGLQGDMARIASAEKLAGMDLTSRAHEAELNRAFTAAQNQFSAETQKVIAGMQIDANAKQQLAGLQQNTLINFNQQIASIFNSQMSAEDKQKYYQNILSSYTGSPYFAYQPAAGAYTPPPPPPAPPPPPPNGN